jgi:hypothetical protein
MPENIFGRHALPLMAAGWRPPNLWDAAALPLHNPTAAAYALFDRGRPNCSIFHMFRTFVLTISSPGDVIHQARGARHAGEGKHAGEG